MRAAEFKFPAGAVPGSDLLDVHLLGEAGMLNALATLHKGKARPDYANPVGGPELIGLMWIDDTNDPLWTINLYIGNDTDILWGVFDALNNEFRAVGGAGSAGVPYRFDTSTNTAVDPGAGLIRFNNAAPGSVGNIAFSHANAYGGSVAAWLATFDDANATSDRGTILVQSLVNPEKFMSYRVIGAVTVGAGFTVAPVTPIASHGTLADNERVAVLFIPSGATGAPGTNGTNGSNGTNGVFSGVEAIFTNNATLVAADTGKNVIANKATAISLAFGPIASLGSTFMIQVRNNGAGTLTLDPNGAELINGLATIDIATGEGAIVWCNGSALRANLFRGAAAGALLAANNLSDLASAATAFGNIKQAASTSATGVAELATDAEAQALSDTARVVTPSNIAALVATQANQEAGSAVDRFVTPGRQQYHPSACKAWCHAIGNGSGVNSHYNAPSVTDNGVGNITINIGTDFSSGSYSVTCALEYSSGFLVYRVNGLAVGTVQVLSFDATPTLVDPTGYHIHAFGDQA